MKKSRRYGGVGGTQCGTKDVKIADVSPDFALISSSDPSNVLCSADLMDVFCFSCAKLD